MNIRSGIIDRLILPYFVIEGRGKRQKIASMPGVFRFTVDMLLEDVAQAYRFGINKILLFGVCSTRRKDSVGSFSCSDVSMVVLAIRAIKARFPKLVVMTDVCLCAYTDHGHCGVLRKRQRSGRFIDGVQTRRALSRMAVAHADAGADWVAPSAMADGQVRAIRKALDNAGHQEVRILGYSAKFASSFYGPFREAAHSAPSFGDRSGYQIHPLDAGRVVSEIRADIREGADMVMVKPALAYLDVIRQARTISSVPLAAYSVSGEYAMIKTAAKAGCINEQAVVFETMSAIRRAGADMIITYHAKDIATWEKKS